MKIFHFLVIINVLALHSCQVFKKTSSSQLVAKDSINTIKTIQLDNVQVKPESINPREFIEQKMDILHTDLDIKFNWGKHECIGKADILLKPYYYETDSIILNAKSMFFDGIQIIDQDKQQIDYLVDYNQQILKLKLSRKISKDDTLHLKLSYIARPDENKVKGGRAIRDDKGLYFINTQNKEPYKPIQIWTQGETESSSCWFPTIDKPIEKFTSSLTIHVNKDLNILSNGLKVNSQIEGNTLTETWVNTAPMPAYLMMMAIGNFTKTTDSILNKEVSYYVEKEYQSYAKNIFKHTPEMIDFFSSKLGVEYPWPKYAQVVVRDYVSGAMENTSATLHGEFVQKNDRELIDKKNDDIIAHELFHQWFGDLVTCKTWSQLVLNEGFATYGELLWDEYHVGTDAALLKASSFIQRYLNYVKNNQDNPIIYTNYKDPDDMFNSITYQKGAAVFHLLRTTLGDQAFFGALKNYLIKYANSNADIDDIRKEFELVSGKDLQPFFNQWFKRLGHPMIDIRYQFLDSGVVSVQIEQKQREEFGLFSFPLKFKVTQDGQTRQFVFDIHQRKEIFFVKKISEDMVGFPNVFVDPESTFIGEIVDNKPIINLLHTYNKNSNYIEKNRTLLELAKLQTQTDTARFTLLSAINDPLADIRLSALQIIDWKNPKTINETKELLPYLAQNDVDASVRSKATEIIALRNDPYLLSTLLGLTDDSSYTVAGNALMGVYKILPEEALRLIPKLMTDAKGKLFESISEIISLGGDVSYLSFFQNNLMQVHGRKRSYLMHDYADFVIRLKDPSAIAQAVADFQARATEDDLPYTRFSSIECLNNIREFYRTEAKLSKDENDKKAALQNSAIIQESMFKLIQAEQDEYVLSLLKLNGISSNIE